MNATKALAISMASATALAIAVLITVDEPSGAASLPPGIRLDQPHRMPLPRPEDGRMLRDVNRQSFRSHWPLVEDKATITCRPNGIATVITSSGEYGLSGLAIAAGYPSIWDAVLPVQLRRDAALAPLAEAALALCPATESGDPSRGWEIGEPTVGGLARLAPASTRVRPRSNAAAAGAIG